MQTASGLQRPCLGSGNVQIGIRQRGPAALARLPVRRTTRRTPVRPAALLADPASAESTLFLAQQLYSFCSTLAGFVSVSSVAYGVSALAKSGRLAAPAAAPATVAPAPATQIDTPKATTAAEQQEAAAVPAPVAFSAPLAIEDIRAELQQAADAAVASFQTAQAEPAARPAAAAKPAAAAAAPPAGDRLTADDATRQVKEWIAAWGAKPEQEEQGPPEPMVLAPVTPVASASAPVVADVTPATAAAVLDAMTASTPVGISPTELPAEAPMAPAEEAAEPVVLAAVAAPTSAPSDQDAEDAAAAADRAYRERIAAALADSPAAAVSSAPAVPEVLGKAVTVGEDYQSKIDAIWRSSEARKEAERELLARSEAMLAQLAQQEEAERAAIEAPTAAAAAPAAEQQQEQLSLVARVLAFFQYIRELVARFVALITGQGGSAPSAA